jgi:aminoglycoside phosphotransferase (APT) family kinase protein
MNATPSPDLAAVAAAFEIPGRFVRAERIGAGHIHETYVSVFAEGDRAVRYVHQRLNDGVFRSPDLLAQNAARVAAALDRSGAAGVAIPRTVPTRDGSALHRDAAGRPWRTARYVPGRNYLVPPNARLAEEAARAFGAFQAALLTLPPDALAEPIPGFHDTPARFARFEEAVARDAAGRAAACRSEIAFAAARRGLCPLLLDLNRTGAIPTRVAHDDAKISNVIFAPAADRAVCILDLDTVMPGLSLYDFGDLVRSMACRAAEDERDASRVEMAPEMFAAIARGYLAETRGFLTPVEREHMVASGIVITFETGIRFLTDHLNGDVYFHVSRPGQNLDRCRTQFRLVQSIERGRSDLERLARGLSASAE